MEVRFYEQGGTNISESVTREQQLIALWDQHLGAEFGMRSPEHALATMVDHPTVIEGPVLMGGIGKEQLRDFYAHHFLNQIPPDIAMIPISRTVGQDRIVDEMFVSFTHSCVMELVLPGVQPTGRRVEMVLIIVVQFKDDKIAREHLYWDQAAVLVQVGLLERGTLPVVGAEGARQMVNATAPLKPTTPSRNPRQLAPRQRYVEKIAVGRASLPAGNPPKIAGRGPFDYVVARRSTAA